MNASRRSLAAQVAQADKTTIYSIAFGSESSGCTGSGGTDTSVSATATTGQPALSVTGTSALTPCIVMKNIATPTTPPPASIDYFYADTSSTTNGCVAGANQLSSIGDIFASIGATFTAPILLPAGASGVAVNSF